MRHAELERFSEQLLGALRSPVERFNDVPVWGRAFLAAVAAVASYITADAFRGALTLVVAAGFFDWVIGVRLAKAKGTYDPCKARLGWQGKATGLVLLLLIRGTELWVSRTGYDTKGWLATSAAMFLVVVELKSIAHLREEFGQKPIPGINVVFSWMDQYAASKVPRPKVPAIELPPPEGDDDEERRP